VRKDRSFEREEMILAAVTGITEFGGMPMEVMTARSSALGTLNIRTSHFEDVLQTPVDRSEAAWKTAVEEQGISHRIVTLASVRAERIYKVLAT